MDQEENRRQKTMNKEINIKIDLIRDGAEFMRSDHCDMKCCSNFFIISIELIFPFIIY